VLAAIPVSRWLTACADMTMNRILILAALLVIGCRSNQPPDPILGVRPEHADRVKIALYSATPRPSTATLEVFEEPPARPHKEIALITCDGEYGEQTVMIEAILYQARRIGADAVVMLKPDTRHGGFGIPNGRIWRCKAIVYSRQ